MTRLYRLAAFMLVILGAAGMFCVLVVSLPVLWMLDFIGWIYRKGRKNDR